MTKVLIATDKPFAPVAVKGIREIVEAQGYELALLEKYTSPEELIAAVADVDAMIIRSDKATKEVIDAAKKLKVIVRAGAGRSRHYKLVIIAVGSETIDVILLATFFQFTVCIHNERLGSACISLVIVQGIQIFVSVEHPVSSPIVHKAIAGSSNFTAFQ